MYTHELKTFQNGTVVNFRGTIILQLIMLVLCTCFLKLKIIYSSISRLNIISFEIIKN